MADIDTNSQIEFVPHPTSKSFQDLTNRVFGRLKVLGYAGKRAWLCMCVCGNVTVAAGNNLKSGNTTSCGCFHKEVTAARSTTHGARRKDAPPQRKRAYNVYASQKQRTTNPNDRYFKDYGGRGIKQEYSFLEFEESLPEGGIPEGMEIDREDNDGNYSVENIRLATRNEQNNNMRRNRRITYMGIEQTLAQWCMEIGLAYYTTKQRLNLGWCVECAFEVPKYGRCKHRIAGKTAKY